MNRDVRRRAQDRCEYCHLAASVYSTSIISLRASMEGLTVLENLAFACLHCNKHKGPNIAGTDPNTGELIRLFHPRTDHWDEHFEWTGAALTGKTAIGRATIHVLAINSPDFLAVREALIREQAFPLE